MTSISSLINQALLPAAERPSQIDAIHRWIRANQHTPPAKQIFIRSAWHALLTQCFSRFTFSEYRSLLQRIQIVFLYDETETFNLLQKIINNSLQSSHFIVFTTPAAYQAAAHIAHTGDRILFAQLAMCIRAAAAHARSLRIVVENIQQISDDAIYHTMLLIYNRGMQLYQQTRDVIPNARVVQQILFYPNLISKKRSHPEDHGYDNSPPIKQMRSTTIHTQP